MNNNEINDHSVRENVIMPAIQKANETMPNFFLSKIDENIVFYGRPKAILDSLNLVSFVFILEEQVENYFKIKITITTQDVLDTETAPFASFDNLSQFLLLKIQEQKSKT